MIRRANASDIRAITIMAKHFAATVDAEMPFSAAYAEARARATINDQNGVVILWDEGGPVGVLAGIVHTHLLYPVPVASEMIWWIEPSHRGRAWRPMLRAFEEWANEKGAHRTIMACLNERTGSLYARSGYKATNERHWTKVLR